MGRPQSSRITCWMDKPYRKKNGTYVYRFRYSLPTQDRGRVRKLENVPQEIAHNARHKTRALEYMLRRQAELNAGGVLVPSVTLGQAIEKYVAHMQPKWKASTLRVNRTMLKHFAAYAGETTPLASIIGDTLVSYLDGRLHGTIGGPPVRSATFNRLRGGLSAFFRQMVRTFGLMARSPCGGISLLAPDGADVPALEKPTLTDEQAAAVIAEAMRRDRVQGVCLWVLGETGMRVGELLSREWPHLQHTERGRAYFALPASETKAKRERVPPILSDELTRELAARKASLAVAGRLSGFIFRPWREAVPGMWKQRAFKTCRCRLSEFLRGICRDLGLAEITPHGLRRTTSSAAEEAGAPEDSILESVGWADKRVRDRHYVAPRVLRQRRMKHAHQVADARGFGRLVAGAMAS